MYEYTAPNVSWDLGNNCEKHWNAEVFSSGHMNDPTVSLAMVFQCSLQPWQKDKIAR
jgi:hypothetical protein